MKKHPILILAAIPVIILLVVLLVVLITGPSGTTSPTVTTSDTTAFHIDSLIMGNADSATSELKVTIKSVKLLESTEITKRINRSIEQLAYNQLFGDTLSSEGTFTTAFSEEYVSYLSDLPEDQTWEIVQEGTVVKNSKNIFTVLLTSYQYLGGAHGNSNTLYLNFSTTTGELLTLRDLVKIEHVVELAQVAEQLFREENEIKPEGSLQEAGFWFQNDKFSLSQNVGLTDEGLIFYYNSYEIAPYALGPTKLLIPLDKCSSWLTY